MKEILSLLGDSESIAIAAEIDVIFQNETLCDLLVRDCVQLFFHLIWIKEMEWKSSK